MIAPAVVLSGAAVGGGLAMVIAALWPTTPDLRSALARVNSAAALTSDLPTSTAGESAWRIRSRSHLPGLAARLGLGRYDADLYLVGETPEKLVARKLGYGVLGLAFPPVLVIAMSLIGLALPVTIPAVASLALAALLFHVPDLDLRRRSSRTRDEMRRAVSVYLELVALERAADAGTAEALNRAAAIGDGRAFSLIREALLRSHLAGAPPWEGLGRLAEELRVPELGDVADIVRLSGEDGAAVYATLRARAASLRTALLNDAASDANAASEHMIMPVAFLGVIFMALLGYPAFARILFG